MHVANFGRARRFAGSSTVVETSVVDVSFLCFITLIFVCETLFGDVATVAGAFVCVFSVFCVISLLVSNKGCSRMIVFEMSNVY